MMAAWHSGQAHARMTSVLFRPSLRDVLLNSALSDQNAMAHKICAASHALITLALFGLLDIVRSPSDVNFCGFLILASIAAALGCWKRWRWLVALAGVPLMIGAAVALPLQHCSIK